jgi:hypothetical protein
MNEKPKRKYTRKPKAVAPEAPVAVAAPEAPVAPPAPPPPPPKVNAYMRKPELIPAITNDRHVMPLEVFKAAAARGGFIPYDGDGFYADATHYDADASVWIVSQPDWALKVVWFNK